MYEKLVNWRVGGTKINSGMFGKGGSGAVLSIYTVLDLTLPNKATTSGTTPSHPNKRVGL